MQKLISILTCFFFMFSLVTPGTVLGQAQAPVAPAPMPGEQQKLTVGEPEPRVEPIDLTKSLNPYLISVPEKSGRIEEVFEARGEAPLIVYIQTAHANYEAQLHIKEILEHLTENYGFSLIQVEGAAAKLNPAILQPSYSREANLKLVDYLLRQGRITGTDAFAVETDLPVDIYGIEDPNLYAENLRTFRSIYAHREEVDTFFSEIRSFIKDLRSRLLNEELLDLTRNMEAYSKEKIELLDYLLYLHELAERHKIISLKNWEDAFRLPNLFRILRLHEMEEEMDEAKLKEETAKLRREFESKGPLSEEVAEILERLDQKEKGLKPRAYFKELGRVAEEAGIDLLPYDRLAQFAEFLILQDEVNHQRLFSEIRDFEKLLKRELLQNGDERLLLQIISDVSFLEQYFHLEVNREKLGEFLKHRDRMRPSWIASELGNLGQKHELALPAMANLEKLDGLMKDLEYYYRLVLKRDLTFVEKIQARMKELGQQKTILVTGGFHTDGLTNLFRSGNLSYVTVIPKVDIKQGNENYVKVMLGEDTAVGSIFAGTFAHEVPTILEPRSGVDTRNVVETLIGPVAGLPFGEIGVAEGGIDLERAEGQLKIWSEAVGTVSLKIESVSEPGVVPVEVKIRGVAALSPTDVREVRTTITMDQERNFEIKIEIGREVSADRLRRAGGELPNRLGIDVRGADSPDLLNLPGLRSVTVTGRVIPEAPVTTGPELFETIALGRRFAVVPPAEELPPAARPIAALIFQAARSVLPAVLEKVEQAAGIPTEVELKGALEPSRAAKFSAEIIAQVPGISEVNRQRLRAILAPDVTTPLVGIYYSERGQETSITNPNVWVAISDLLVNDGNLRLMIHHVGEKADGEALLEALGPELAERVQIKISANPNQVLANLLNPAIPFNAFKEDLGIVSVTELPDKTVFVNLPDSEEVRGKIEILFSGALGFQTVEEMIQAETNPVIREALQHLGVSLPVAIARIKIIKKLEVIAEAIKELGFSPDIVNFITTNVGIFTQGLIQAELERYQLEYRAARELAVKA